MGNNLTMAEAVERGPTHLEKITTPIPVDANRLNGGNSVPYFMGALKSPSGGAKFKIKFSGRMQDSAEGSQYILNDPHPTRVVAEDSLTGEHFLLIDFGVHGYDQLVVYGPTPDTKPLAHTYEWDGKTDFSVVVTATYNNHYDDPHEGFIEDVRPDGNLTFDTEDEVRRTMSFDDFRRDGFDWFEIEIVREGGERLEILSAELA